MNTLEDLASQRMVSDFEITSRPRLQVAFVPDEKKTGGAYVTVTGNLKCIEEYQGQLILTNGKKILMDEIVDIQSNLFWGKQ